MARTSGLRHHPFAASVAKLLSVFSLLESPYPFHCPQQRWPGHSCHAEPLLHIQRPSRCLVLTCACCDQVSASSSHIRMAAKDVRGTGRGHWDLAGCSAALGSGSFEPADQLRTRATVTRPTLTRRQVQRFLHVLSCRTTSARHLCHGQLPVFVLLRNIG